MVNITTLLNIIGIVCILVSLIIISRTTNKEESIYEDILNKHEDIKYYYKSMDNILNSFSEIVYMGFNKFERLNDTKIVEFSAMENSQDYNSTRKNLLKEQQNIDNESETFRKIVEFKKHGLSSKEIAKRINKGIREVEIIIKMMENN